MNQIQCLEAMDRHSLGAIYRLVSKVRSASAIPGSGIQCVDSDCPAAPGGLVAAATSTPTEADCAALVVGHGSRVLAPEELPQRSRPG